MMKHLACVLTLSGGIAFACVAGVDEVASSQSMEPTNPAQGATVDWSQTRLVSEPVLRTQMESTEELLGGNTGGLAAEVSRMKADGVLDRRSATEIRTALDHARDSIGRLTQDIEARRHIDGEKARLVSYELGLAADALVQQADAISTEPDGVAAAVPPWPPVAPSSDTEQRQQLAARLRQSADLLRGTARQIVADLR